MIAPVREIPAIIRPMVHGDLGQVSDVERRSYEFPWSHGVFRDCLLAGYHCIVVERDGRVVGYAILSVAASEAHILNLCVHPTFRKHGYGERLLASLIEHSRKAEVREMFLEVRPSNTAAIALYRKKGFRHIANRPSYYQASIGREDASVLTKTLKRHD